MIAGDAEVLVRAEHESCTYNGVEYVRHGKITGTHPLVTVREVGNGTVVRQYAAVSLPVALGAERHKILVENLAQYIRKLYNERAAR